MQISQHKLEKQDCCPCLVGHRQKFSLLFVSIRLFPFPPEMGGVASLDTLVCDINDAGDSHLDEFWEDTIAKGETHLDTLVVEGGVVNRLEMGVAIFVKSGWDTELRDIRGRGTACGYTKL